MRSPKRMILASGALECWKRIERGFLYDPGAETKALPDKTVWDSNSDKIIISKRREDMSGDTFDLRISLSTGDDTDKEAINEHVLQVSERLSAMKMSTEIPEDRRPPDSVEGESSGQGTILVKQIADEHTINDVISVMKPWLAQEQRRKATFHVGENKIEVSEISEKNHRHIIKLFRPLASLPGDITTDPPMPEP